MANIRAAAKIRLVSGVWLVGVWLTGEQYAERAIGRASGPQQNMIFC